ncbi:ProQ/FINO family protein [Marinomonas sp. THO17]|uniref:ProQ/FINO family protein n=1 Tax=Marinomonas sp. THO17 TaxID=3149048 RepID=UPI00336C29DA
MEHLIAQLEARIGQLTKQLEEANEEIAKLKDSKHTANEHNASLDLLTQMESRSTEDQLQFYIEDSLDLLSPTKTPSPKRKVNTMVEQQLNFDLLYEGADNDTTNTTTEQTNYMTTQQPESSKLAEEETNTDIEQMTNDAADKQSAPDKQEVTLTPEQKKRQRNQKNNRRLIKMLEDRYPKAFNWNQPKPLKVGIDKDMVLDDDFNASKQKRALAAYTRSDRYKKCLLSGQPRIDLEGVAVNDEPALPESMMPTKPKATTNRPAKDKTPRANKAKSKPQHNKKPKKAETKEDSIYDNLSPEERMKAKLEKLLNKS